MEAYINFIESQLKNERSCEMLYDFKKQIISDMTNRANEITHTGLTDPKVLSDLVISEHSNIKAEYRSFMLKKTEKKRKQRALISNVLGSLIFIISSVIIYLSFSFSTMKWASSWLIIEGAMSLWIVFELGIIIKKATKSKKLFHPIARILLATNVMIITQFVFFLSLIVLQIPHSWLMFIIGVILIFVCDGIYTAVTKQRLAILNYLFYILASSPMVYILLSVLGVTAWSTGWLIIPMALLVDMIIVAIKVIANKSKVIYEEVE